MSGHGGSAAAAVFDYTVDDEPQHTSEHMLTARQVLTNAGLDPAQRYLIQLVGTNKVSYQDKPDEQIHMHEKMVFITAGLGPTPVS